MSFIFRYPAIAPTDIVTLRNPDLGDIDRHDARVIINRSRAGELNVSKPTDRPNQHTINIAFSALTRTERDQLLDFLNQSAGDLVNVTDHNGLTYDALITSGEPTITTSQDGCFYSIPLDILIPPPVAEVSPSPS